jgi:hypothetical protein
MGVAVFSIHPCLIMAPSYPEQLEPLAGVSQSMAFSTAHQRRGAPIRSQRCIECSSPHFGWLCCRSRLGGTITTVSLAQPQAM